MPKVIPITTDQEPYVSSFWLRELDLPGGDALRAVRHTAIERFAALGFPTTRNEDWKYTNLTPWLKTVYEPAPRPEAWLGSTESAGPALVFLNGCYVPELSKPAGLRVVPIERIHAEFDTNALVALNTALFDGGVAIEVPPGTELDQPLSITYSTFADRPCSTYPRAQIRIGRGSQVRILEGFVGDGPYFTDSVTEVFAAEDAIVEHYKLQFESSAALHFGHLAVRQGRASNFKSFSFAFGGGMVRNEIVTVLEGEGAECTLNGLFVETGKQHVDNHTTLDHAQPHTSSREMYKGILDGASQGVFHGRIIVRPEAQKTDAIQRNRNLLLSKEAVINTKPQLEIYADDVRCTHGATVGQVDEDAVFYLRSRGIALEEARSLLTVAFAGEIVDEVKVESVRSQLRDALVERLRKKES